jgi:N-acetylglutamate synthase-like GNAT family acetyltransferase
MDPREKEELPPDITIRSTLRPGDIGYVTYLHGTLYAAEYGWDHTFEAYVAGPLAEFSKSHNDRQRIWIVEREGKVAGSIAIVEASLEEAQLRWFLLHPSLRGRGVGRILMDNAIDFCKESGYSHVFLWTEGRLTAATRLYESFGFRLTSQETHELWGTTVTEQRYDLTIA